MQSGVISKRKNKYAQVFSTPFGWARAFPMQKKSDAHEALSTLFKRDGVPNSLVMDGSKEQTLSKFRTKCRESDCHVKQVEPYSPWSNSCEGTIKMAKLAAGRDLRRSKCPKVLWDDCIERQSYIRSFTAHDIYDLKGETLECLINGETPDISEFAESKWYEWVKFRDAQVAFPDDNFVLARYLGPSFDIGPAMTAKLLKENGEYVHRSTYRGLTEDEIKDPLEIKARELFDIAINDRLGAEATIADFSKEELDVETPINPLYEDDCDKNLPHVPDRDDIEDDHYDQYIGSDVLLPLGDKFKTGRVTGRKRNADGKETGTANPNSILDSREYIIEFPDGAEAEYSANVIAENMYAQCDIDGHQHLILDAIVDYKKDANAIAMTDRYQIIKGRKYLRKTTKGKLKKKRATTAHKFGYTTTV